MPRKQCDMDQLRVNGREIVTVNFFEEVLNVHEPEQESTVLVMLGIPLP